MVEPDTQPGDASTTNIQDPLVLVVDDEPFIQLALGTMLTKLGCKVEKASNGEIGADMVIQHNSQKETKFDMVFMDANMPVLNGYESAKKIRKDALIQCPIICISAQDSAEHQQLCKEAKMDQASKFNQYVFLVSKPCSLLQLKGVLQKYSKTFSLKFVK